MKRYISIIILIFLTSSLCLAEEKESLFRFIENKNQWDKKILFKANIPSGVLFLESNKLTYNLIDLSTLHKLHAHADTTNIPGLKLQGHAFSVSFKGCNTSPIIEGTKEEEGYYNFFQGKDPSKWASHVSSYQEVNYNDLYPGIDLKIYTASTHLKYDFKVLVGADPSVIKLQYAGIDKLSLSNGSLILETALGKITEQKPFAYQVIDGRKVEVPCNFVLIDKEISFSFPRGYDKRFKLIIDPELLFSTYSGSSADNFGYTATYDSDGFLYSGSSVFGIGYPVTSGAYQTFFMGGSATRYSQFIGTDIAITKYDTTLAASKKRIYSTYLGGTQDELPHSLIVDHDNNLIILGTTSSKDYPVTNGVYDNTFAGDSVIVMSGIAAVYLNGSDIIISKLNSSGSTLVASTFLGGTGNDGLLSLSDYVYDPINGYVFGWSASALRYNYADEVRGEVEIDANNNIYIASCTKSRDFPTTASVQPTYAGGNFEAVVAKLSSDLSTLKWSTYLGGLGDDAAYSLELDTTGNIYVAGGTTSNNFPITSGVLFPNQMGGRSDGFITCLDSSGTAILHSSYFGSPSYDQIYFVDLDAFNNVYVFGQTMAPGSTFVVNAAYSVPNSGQFISKLQPNLSSYIWSTVFGNGSGRPNISPTAFLVDLCSKIYLSGWGGTPEHNAFGSAIYNFTMPLKAPAISTDYYQPTTDDEDFYLFVLEDDASKVDYASYFGGPFSAEHVDGGTSRFDKKGKIYQAICGGCGGNNDLPISPVFPNNSSNCNCAVFKMDFNLPIVVADFSVMPSCSGDVVQFTNKSLEQKATHFEWHFGDGSPVVTTKNPTHVYNKGGLYNVMLVVKDNLTCNLSDTLVKSLYISDIGNVNLSATTDRDTIYRGQSTQLHAIPNSGYSFNWSPTGSLTNYLGPNPTATPDTTTTYTVTISDPILPQCTKSANVKVVVIEVFCEEPHIFIPNAFTPDGDGKNDVLYVRGNNITSMKFAIYNRWGEKVFETYDQTVGWDGYYQGMKVDPGVFDYYLEVLCINEQKFFKKGNITLIR